MPGIKIFRFHAPLFYANTEYFQEELFKATVSPSDCIKWPVPRCYQYHNEDLTSEKHSVKHSVKHTLLYRKMLDKNYEISDE